MSQSMDYLSGVGFVERSHAVHGVGVFASERVNVVNRFEVAVANASCLKKKQSKDVGHRFGCKEQNEHEHQGHRRIGRVGES